MLFPTQAKVLVRRRISCRNLGCLGLLVGMLLNGCKVPPPQGTPITPVPLGSVVDEANLTQEDNAEPAKFIVYRHEFALNKNWNHEHLNGFGLASHDEEYQGADTTRADTTHSGYGLSVQQLENASDAEIASIIGKQEGTDRVRGLRLTPDGEDHLRQIAVQLQRGIGEMVVVERSNTSRREDSRYHYPIHYNHDLDVARRLLIVNTLSELGVNDADALVIVGPAYPFGLSAREATRAYQRSYNSNSNQNNGGGGGRGGGFGGRGTF